MLTDRPFRFTHAVEVRFRDLDALGHVNNAVYLTYFESARMAWWMHLTHRTDLRRMDMILARAEVDFRSPAAYAEVLDVGVRCASIGRSSCRETSQTKDSWRPKTFPIWTSSSR